MTRRTAIAALLAVSLAALSASNADTLDLRARPALGDPEAMYIVKDAATDGIHVVTTAVPRTGISEYTFVFWVAAEQNRWGQSTDNVILSSFFSVAPGLATSEGGDPVQEFTDFGWPYAILPLSAQGTWSATCLPPCSDYIVPNLSLSNAWQYGCYVANIQTDTALTLTVGGDERQVPASDAVQVLTFRPVSADRSVTIAAESPDAQISLAIADCPLVQFFGANICDYTTSDGFFTRREIALSNEWTMVALRTRIEDAGSRLVYDQTALPLDGQEPKDYNTHSAAIDAPHADGCFARNARIEFTASRVGGLQIKDTGRDFRRSVWGAKFYARWLSDDLLYAIRDADAATLYRRGIAPFANFDDPQGD